MSEINKIHENYSSEINKSRLCYSEAIFKKTGNRNLKYSVSKFPKYEIGFTNTASVYVNKKIIHTGFDGNTFLRLVPSNYTIPSYYNFKFANCRMFNYIKDEDDNLLFRLYNPKRNTVMFYISANTLLIQCKGCILESIARGNNDLHFYNCIPNLNCNSTKVYVSSSKVLYKWCDVYRRYSDYEWNVDLYEVI